MSKKESNKNIYIFWGAIALIVVIVFLVIFLPRTNTTRTYNNMLQISEVIKKQDTHNKDITYYANQFLLSPLEDSKKDQARALLHLQLSMEYSTSYALTALQFVGKNQNFNKLYNAQISAFNSSQNELSVVLNYCQNNVYQWFENPETQKNDIFKQTFNAFLQKYQTAIQQLADFYVATSELLTLNATQGIEITQSNLEKNEQFMKQIQEQAYKETLLPSQCNTIYENVYKTSSIYFVFN